MIEVGMSQFFALVLVAVAAMAGLSVCWDKVQDRRAVRAVRRNSVRCRICGAAYRRNRGAVLQTCPDCGSSNRRGRDRRLG